MTVDGWMGVVVVVVGGVGVGARRCRRRCRVVSDGDGVGDGVRWCGYGLMTTVVWWCSDGAVPMVGAYGRCRTTGAHGGRADGVRCDGVGVGVGVGR